MAKVSGGERSSGLVLTNSSKGGDIYADGSAVVRVSSEFGKRGKKIEERITLMKIPLLLVKDRPVPGYHRPPF